MQTKTPQEALARTHTPCTVLKYDCPAPLAVPLACAHTRQTQLGLRTVSSHPAQVEGLFMVLRSRNATITQTQST